MMKNPEQQKKSIKHMKHVNEQQLQHIYEKVVQTTSLYALFLVNIKSFQMFNYVYGRDCGDFILKEVISGILSCLHDGEYATRLEADNYAILIKVDDEQDSIKRLMEIDDHIYVITYEGNRLRIRLSFGIFFLLASVPFLEAIDRANIARLNDIDYPKYNTSWGVYEHEKFKAFYAQLKLESILEESLENQEFQIYLQPKVDTQTTKIVGAEALIRWFHDGVEVPLKYFMPIINQNTFIRKIDLYVFANVCRLLYDWSTKGLPLIPISVNISNASFADHAYYLEAIQSIHKRYQVDKAYLEFELSEETSFGNEKAFMQFIQTLNKHKFACSLDDFGSGYSSLNILQTLPIQTLKLDQAFFNKDISKRNIIILEGIFHIAQKLGLSCVAEGVETKAYYEVLKAMKCDMIQGYYFHRPLTIPNFEQLLQSEQS